MKKTAIYEQVEASKHFNPYSLKDFLTRTKEGDVIVFTYFNELTEVLIAAEDAGEKK